ncbi:MAG: amino acid adenylation domain-containing protein [Actinomycetota bacterium]
MGALDEGADWRDARQEFHASNLPRRPAAFEHFLKADVEQSMAARFEQIVERHPDKPAIVTPEWSLTYRTLNDRANRIARTILDRFGPDPQQVGFVLPNDGTAIAAMLGILKAGKSYVPLDPNFPRDRLAIMLEDAETAFLLTDTVHEPTAKDLAPETAVVNLDTVDPAASADNPVLDVDPGSVAYLLFTSGSTGRPKGIGFPHRGLLHTTMGLVNSLRIGPEDRLTQLHSTSFAASIVDIYCGLMSGATVYPWDVKVRGFAGLADWLRQERVTSFQWIPTPFRHFIDTLDADETFPDIRMVIMASESLTAKELALHRRHFPPDSLLVNQMGTSESFNYNLALIGHETEVDGYTMPAGFSVSEDRDALILDDDHKVVPQGESGEIAIRSPYLAIGYWRQPELTAEKFLDDPDGSDARIYLTGDLGRIADDGSLVHLGRKDFQVKIRGYRVELAEIETTITAAPWARDAIVVADEAPDGGQRLVAYIVPEPDAGPLASADVAEYLSDRLPDYMVPARIVDMEAFPTTATGKLDRLRLPSPEQAASPVGSTDAGRDRVAPSTPTEIQLARLWSTMLGVSDIGVHDGFFDLGGHSLTAAQMFARIEKDMGVRLPLSTLFRASTIAELAAVVDGSGAAPSWSSLVPIKPTGAEAPLYLVHAHGGNVLGYFDLSTHLAQDRPLYGLQARGLDGVSIEERSMEEIADGYLEEIRALQPNGPYHLGGFCFGGNVAFAMAERLRSVGEEVALLVLIESRHKDYPVYPETVSTGNKLAGAVIGVARYEWSRATRQGRASIRPHLTARVVRVGQIASVAVQRRLQRLAGRIGRSLPASDAYRQQRLQDVHDRAYHGVTTTPIESPTLLFRASNQPSGIEPDALLGWGPYLHGEVVDHELPGFTVGILEEPQVAALVDVLNRRLDPPG